MTLEKLHEATKAAFTDLERQIRELRYVLHNASAEIADLRDRLDQVGPRLDAVEAETM